jgi:pimeloyl-ACP methyl ester carboxylesterase
MPFVSINNFTIHYKTFGSGPTYVLAFHGFGQNCDAFSPIIQNLLNSHTFIVFDHFHHGLSSYPPSIPKSIPFHPDILIKAIENITLTYNINSFWLMGYSLGGKVALTLFRKLSHKTNGIILLAPDGIIESGWYKFVSRNKLGESLYKAVINKPDFFFYTLKTLHAAGAVKDKVYKFVLTSLNSKQRRKLVYYTWRSYADFRPDLNEIKKTINQLKIPVLIITGTYDTVLHPKIGKSMIKDLINPNVRHVQVNAGHDLLKPRIADILKKNLEILQSCD